MLLLFKMYKLKNIIISSYQLEKKYNYERYLNYFTDQTGLLDVL